jgi:hypothetical protein
LNICGKLSHPGIKKVVNLTRSGGATHSSTGQALPYVVTTEQGTLKTYRQVINRSHKNITACPGGKQGEVAPPLKPTAEE